MLPQANAYEGTPVQGVEIYPVSSLREAWHLLTSDALPPPFTGLGREAHAPRDKDAAVDFDEIKGQPYARRAMEIAAAGGHNIRQIHAGAKAPDHSSASESGGSAGDQ